MPYTPPEYDPNAPYQMGRSRTQVNNAQQGATAGGSVANAAIQGGGQPRGGGNPFAEMINHVSAFNGARFGQPAGQPVGAQQPAVNRQQQPLVQAPTAQPSFQREGINYQTAAAVDNKDVGETGGGGSGGTPPTGGGTPTEPPPTGPTDPGPPTGGEGGKNRGAGQQPTPQGWTDQQWAEFNEWSSVPGYTWLKNEPGLVLEYLTNNWALRQGNNSEWQGVDFVDWLYHRMNGNGSHPLYRRSGYDTYLYKDRNYTPRGYASQGGPTYNPTNAGPGGYVTPKYQGGGPDAPAYYDQDGTPRNNDGSRWKPKPAPTTPPAGQGGPYEKSTPFTNEGQSRPSTPYKPPPTGPQYPREGPYYHNPDPGEGAPTSGPGSTGFLDELNRMFNPMFEREANQFTKRARAASAVGGGYADDSGGFGTQLSEGLSQLSADQGSRMTDFAMTAAEKTKDRQTQIQLANIQAQSAQYKADTDKFIAQLNAEIAQIGFQSDEEVAKYVADKKAEMEKYGIDANDVLERYRLEVQKEIAVSESNAANRGAALGSAMENAFGSVMARFNQQEMDLRRDLGYAGFDIDRERNWMNFILGLGGQNAEWLNQLRGSSPEWWLSGGGPPPSGGGGGTFVRP